MRLVIAAIGRARQNPEAELVRSYAARIEDLARPLGFTGFEVTEIESRGGDAARNAREAQALLKATPQDAYAVTMDEHGKEMTSEALAAWLARLRDEGTRSCCFLIGGADGLAAEVKERANFSLSLGRMTWPHLMARVMLSEQIYRALTILARHPYHRA